MTTLYRPVKITSAEQAEALPAFTLARYIDGDVRAAIKTVDGIWESVPGFYGEEAHFSEDFVGWTALVPIEAEEEHMSAYAGEPEWEPDWPDGQEITRLVTPWRAQD